MVLLALFPALAGAQVIMRQDCSAYAEEPLRTAGLLEAAHQYSLQDMRESALLQPKENWIAWLGAWGHGDRQNMKAHTLLGRGPHKNCKNDLDDQT